MWSVMAATAAVIIPVKLQTSTSTGDNSPGTVYLELWKTFKCVSLIIGKEEILGY